MDDGAEEEPKREHDLYEPIAKVLSQKWAQDLKLEEYFVQVTAKQGRRETGGTWTRPDILALSVSTYQYVSGKFVDVTTFEVKDHGNLNVTAVYEALAHLRAATKAYVVAVIPRTEWGSKITEETAAEAGRHGVGFILVEQIESYDDWDWRVEAVRSEPDPARLDEFIEAQVSDDNKNKLRKWLK